MLSCTKKFVNCNVCGADDWKIVFPEGVAQISRIVKCNQCGLMYANPRAKPPDCEEIQSWNDNASVALDHDLLTEGGSSSWLAVLRFEKERLQVRDYDDTRGLLKKLHPKNGKLIEIGSGMGFLLQTFRNDGWEVLGVEPDRGACNYAKEYLHVPAVCGLLNDADIPDGACDVVLMMHVIEHVPDPLGLLQEIYRVLKPGGHLVMETPRYDSLMFKILGRRERSVGCDGHLYFFTTDTLRKIYEKAGFRQVRLDLVGRSLTVDRLAFVVAHMSKSKLLHKGLGFVSRKMKLQKIQIYLNFRDMQRVVVERPC
jgi:SAM-dependent methyltransferase